MSVVSKNEISVVVSGDLGIFHIDAKLINGKVDTSIRVQHKRKDTPSQIQEDQWFYIKDIQDLRDLGNLIQESLVELSRAAKT